MIARAGVTSCFDNIVTGNLGSNPGNTVLQQNTCPIGNQDMCIVILEWEFDLFVMFLKMH
jgi:hypothetical protein